MNKREADWLESALTYLRSIPLRVDLAINDIEEALKVRTILPVCEKCLKIGGCEHTKK